jgi:hypothetical protein
MLLSLLSTGCGKKEAGSSADTSSGGATEGTPFLGTIRATQWIGTPLNTFEITYTVGKDQIRRESKSSNVIDKLTGATIMGVICRPKQNEVILYCSALGKKRSYKLTLEDYLLLSKHTSYSSMPYHGYGRIYLNLPEESACSISNTKDHSTIEGRKCDHHELIFTQDILSVNIASDHTRQILVPRDLLILAEPKIPQSITGFPLRVRRVETIQVLQQAGSQPEPEDKYKKWLAKAAKLASDGLKKALESGLDILQVEYGEPESSAFQLTPDYTEVTDLTAYEAEFSELKSSSGDIDD